MNAPAKVMIGLFLFEWAGGCYMHGKPRRPWDIRVVTIDIAIYTAILWWGGFFS